MKQKRVILLLLMVIAHVGYLSAKGFPLFKGGEVAQIYLSESEPTPLKIAAKHLQSDIEMVTGRLPEIVNDKSQLSGHVIVLSTQENNTLLRASQLNGLYDSYMMRAVSSPFAHVESALVVVGSDAMGAVYGAYDISEKIGVSPLYWWCDITPERQSEVVIKNCTVQPHQPSVKFRGIFINDEEASIIWSQRTSKVASQGITPETYKRVFELMTRLKINALWPSMMEEGAYFFEAKDENGIAVNPKNATDYGVWVGTSHCENMARNNNAEWYEWANKNQHLFSDDLYEFDYTVNPEAIEQYWRERLEESKNFNIIYTMGIRAVHDSAFKSRLMKNPNLENRVKMLQKVIYRQRAIIKEVFGSEDAVPQIFVPYEETAELYNGESKNGNEKCKGLDVPEDIILVSTDDNYSFLRQLPTQKELAREGGCGIYYHIAYQGNPAAYDWLTTIPYKQMQQELGKLYRAGAMKFWIVNVGDIKPSEMSLQYFMDIANDADHEFARDPREHLAENAASLFGFNPEQSQQFSDLYTRFCLRANIQKPDFMTTGLSIYYDTPTWAKYSYYSLTDFGDEAQRMIAHYIELEDEAMEMYQKVDPNHQKAFYHLALYPIRSARLMAEKSYYYYKNLIYAKQGRFAAVNGYKNRSLQAAEAIDEDLHYFNKELAGGKWDGIMDPYGTYNIYERVVDDANIPHRFVYNQCYREEATEGLGVVCEGQLLGDEAVDLLFSSLEDNRRFVDLFATGLAPQQWSLESDQPWVKFSQQAGTTASEQRIWVSIDWDLVDAGQQQAVITVKGQNGAVKSFPVVAHRFTEPIKPRSYVEGAGFVSIEAEHYTKSHKGTDGAQWREIADLGYVGSSMAIEGSTKAKSAQRGAMLEYQVYFTSTGTFDATLFRIPTLNEGKGKSCELAIGVDGATPQTLEGVRRKDQTLPRTLASGKKITASTWRMNAFTQIERIPFEVTISEAGYHTIQLYQLDSEMAFDRLVIATTPQSSIAQNRSLVGAPESYNNIVSQPNAAPPVQAEVSLTPSDVAVESYPKIEPMLYAKFLFANYCTNPPIWGFTPVYPRSAYNKNSTLFGWDKEDIRSIISKQSVGYRPVPFFRLMSHWSSKPATFYATMHEGNYEITFHAGNVTEYYSGAKGRELNMTIHANGEELVRNLNIKSDEMQMVKFDAKVGKDNILKIDFSGDWAISVIEIYRK